MSKWVPGKPGNGYAGAVLAPSDGQTLPVTPDTEYQGKIVTQTRGAVNNTISGQFKLSAGTFNGVTLEITGVTDADTAMISPASSAALAITELYYACAKNKLVVHFKSAITTGNEYFNFIIATATPATTLVQGIY